MKWYYVLLLLCLHCASPSKTKKAATDLEPLTPVQKSFFAKSGATELHKRAYLHKKLEIAEGENINQVDANGWTALHYACKRKNAESTVKRLLELGSNEKIQDKYGFTALHFCVTKGESNAVKKLLSTVNIANRYGRIPLHNLARYSKKGEGYAMAKILVEGGSALNVLDLKKNTPMHYAAENDNEKLLVYLVKQGGNVNIPNRFHKTVLQEAKFSGAKFEEDIKDKLVKTYKGNYNMEFVKIPAGSFRRKGVRIQIAKPFLMGKYEVTSGQWEEVMQDNPSYFKDCGKDCPIGFVSWDDIQKFLQKYGKCRLPTNAEWEYAYRAGSTGKYFWGDAEDLAKDYAWYRNSVASGSKPHPVGLKKPNAFGLYDMAGNAAEWVSDWQAPKNGDTVEPYPKRDAVDPQGPASGKYRVYRCNSWNDKIDSLNALKTCADIPGFRGATSGFRLVCDIE